MRLSLLYCLILPLVLSYCRLSGQQEPFSPGRATDSLRFHWEKKSTLTHASLRGLSVVNERVIWASGQYGTLLRTTDGGERWERISIPGIDSADFRDVEAMDEKTAYVLAAGSPAYIFKTVDGGAAWTRQYENTSPDIFLDGMAFWDERHGIAMGDPLDGSFVLLRTDNGGRDWQRIPSNRLPAPTPAEAGFAASGTNIIVQGDRFVWFATGGSVARVFRSSDRGETWEVSRTPMAQGTASQGIFSMAFADLLRGVVVGGDYRSPEAAIQNASYTTDGGRTWYPVISSPRGYRSGVTYLASSSLYIAVGPGGSDYSPDLGTSWYPLDSTGYHSIRSAPTGSVVWVSGSDGQVARITW